MSVALRIRGWLLACAVVGVATPAQAEDPSDPIAGRSHWAFQPLSVSGVPAVAAADWPANRVDAFVLDRLESARLRPAPDATPRDLLRRIHIQLTGLPPTSEEAAEYLGDASPDALEKLVDRLLAAPQFGERWGRHWLDLARYADSNGLDENFLFREAWRYRNWVIGAVNSDLPYDRFLLEQLAGDLLPAASIEQRDSQRIAAGFLVIGPKVLLGNDERNQRMEIADEQLNTIGQAVLGQTIGCARCHDHKFDPIPTADYYALAGILTSTTVLDRRYMLGEQRLMERLVGLGDDGDARQQAYEEYWRELPRVKERRRQAQAALEVLQQTEQALTALQDTAEDALAPGVRDSFGCAAERVAAQKAFVAQLDAVIQQPPPIPPRAMIPTDVPQPAAEHVRVSGQFDRLGEQVPRGFLRVLGPAGTAVLPADHSGRHELAAWLTDVEQGAGRLSARVFANRLWHHLIGVGLVRTVDNFGRTGEAPTHPELLDDLAGELIRSEWSLKAVVRQVVLSRTFRQSTHSDAGVEVDPDNRLLWRAHRRRLDPESFRDALLAACGQLDRTPRESTVAYLGDQATGVGLNPRRRTDFPCRSVYLPVIRNDLPELFEAFNFADPHATTGMRPRTTVPTQALFMLNSDLMIDAAEATARRVLATGDPSMAARVDTLCDLILGQPLPDEARSSLVEFVESARADLANTNENPELQAWALACHSLFASSRFQFLE